MVVNVQQSGGPVFKNMFITFLTYYMLYSKNTFNK